MQLKSVLGTQKYHRLKEAIRSSLSPEQRLLSSIHPMASPDYSVLPVDQINEHTLYGLAVRHRLIPDVFRVISTHPDKFSTDFKQKISSLQQRKLKKGFQQSREIVLLLDHFRKKNLLAVPLKGPVFGQMLYHDIGKRFSSDIDIFLHAGNIELADKEIIDGGYRRVQPAGNFSFSDDVLYARYKKDFMYVHPEKKINLEMHWQLSSNNLLIENAHTLMENLQEITFAGYRIQVMKDEYQFFYLAIHGAMHQFFRLFWLRDIAAYSAKLTDISHEKIVKIVVSNQLELPYISALVAANIFYGTPVPNPVMEMRCSSSLLTSLQIIFSRVHGSEEMSSFERLQKLYYLTLFKPSLNYKIRCLTGVYFRYTFRKKPMP